MITRTIVSAAVLSAVAAVSFSPKESVTCRTAQSDDVKVYALIRMDHGTPEQNDRDVARIHRMQAALVRSRPVVAAALRDPAVATLKMVKERENPIEWFAASINVSFPNDSEIMEIAIPGDTPELIALVNAIASAYLREVAGNEQNEQNARLRHLEKIRNELDARLRDKQNQIQAASEAVGITDGSAEPIERSIAIEHIGFLKKELTRLNLEAVKLHVIQSKQQPDDTAARALSDQAVAEQVEADASVKQLRRHVGEICNNIDTYAQLRPGNDPTFVARQTEILGHAQKALDTALDQVRATVTESMRRSAQEHSRDQSTQIDQATAIIVAQRKALEMELAAERQQFQQLTKASAELRAMRDDLDKLSKSQTSVSTEIGNLRDNLVVLPRMTLLQDARVFRQQD